jgi:hypothetical protein
MIASRQSWCRAIQTYEDTWSFGASKLSHQNCQTMLFGFPRLSFYIFKWHRRSRPSRASAFLRQSLSRTSTRDWQDLKISRFQKKAILIEQNWAKANSLGGYRLRIHGMRWKCHTSWINATAMVPFLQPLDCCAQAADPKQRSIRMTRRP